MIVYWLFRVWGWELLCGLWREVGAAVACTDTDIDGRMEGDGALRLTELALGVWEGSGLRWCWLEEYSYLFKRGVGRVER